MNETALKAPIQITDNPFGFLADGQEVREFTLSNHSDFSVSILNYGGIIRSITIPDIEGNIADIVLGYDTIGGYLNDQTYMGALVGRYANRIANAAFTIDGVTFHLSQNEDNNSHHGGSRGFNKMPWNAQVIRQNNRPALRLQYTSHDGDQGFPGSLQVTATYTILNKELSVEFTAVSDKKTVVNLTQHPYFNLGTPPLDSIADHILQINAKHYLPVNKEMIPTGEQRTVANTPFAFIDPVLIEARINDDSEQLKLANGYDHCYVVDKKNGEDLSEMATLTSLRSGRTLTIFANSPGLQLYTSNYLCGDVKGKGGKPFRKRQAVCLEPQCFPNSPNEQTFPSAVLHPGQLYRHHIIYKFGVMKRAAA